jgi:hypothetical protein
MKTTLNIIAFAVLLLVAPRPCFALWDVLQVSKEEAKKLGMNLQALEAGANHISVTLEFKTDGRFNVFSPESKHNDRSRVELWIGQGDHAQVSAALREDRSKAGSIVVNFTVDRAQLDHCNLRVAVPYSDGGLGGMQIRLRVKDFVEPKADR